MKILVGVATDVGRVREGNEDSYLVDPPLYAVADGMGGARGGEVASQLALETIEGMAQAGEGTLAEQVTEANHAVFARSQEDRSVSGMGTTLTAVHVVDGVGNVAHVGDSRAYLLRGGAMRRLTDDHTLVNRMVKAGEITADEAEVHPHRNVLTRVLGTEPEVKVDVQEVPLMDGDRMLLCSDGLFAMVNEEQIQAIVETEPDPQRAADRLVRAANRAGGIDNITVVVLDAQDGDVRKDPAPSAAGPSSAEEEDGGIRRRRAIRWIAGAVLALVVLVAVWAVARSYITASGTWAFPTAGSRSTRGCQPSRSVSTSVTWWSSRSLTRRRSSAWSTTRPCPTASARTTRPTPRTSSRRCGRI